MSTLNREQQAVLAAILAVARRVHATPMERKAAVETGLVEANLNNPSGGDADSAGWRQERASLYPDPTNISHSAERFFAEARQRRGQYGTAGALAAAVQRPAAQYRGRYQEHSAEAQSLLAGLGGPSSGGGGGRSTASTLPQLQTTVSTGLDQAGYGQAMRKAALAQYLGRVRPNSVLLRTGAISPQAPDPQAFVKAATQLVQSTPGPTGEAAGGGSGSAAVNFAAQRVGHYAETAGKNRGPELDTLQKRFGMTGEAWCAMFATTAAAHGGASRAVRTPSVAQINQWAAEGSHGYQRGLRPASQGQAGDLITFGNHHVGVVASVDRARGTITTIEGNTGNGSVQRRTRPISDGRIARPAY